MKKYLMSGIAAIALCAAFTSCSKGDLYDQSAVDEKNQQEMAAKELALKESYEAAFEKAFGKVGANVDWGFGPSRANTRATGEFANHVGAYPDANMWTSKGFLAPDPLTTSQKLRAQYYFQMVNITDPYRPDYGTKDFFMQQVYDGGTDPMAGKSPEVYKSVANTDIESGEHMDHLTCGPDHTHTYNFNNGNCSPNSNVANRNQTDVNDTNQQHTDQIQLLLNTKTSCFGYANSDASYVRDDRWALVSAATIDNFCDNDPGFATWLAARLPAGEQDVKCDDDFHRDFIGFDFDMIPDNETYVWNWENGQKTTPATVKYNWASPQGGNLIYTEDGQWSEFTDWNAEITVKNGKVFRVLDAQTNKYCGEVKGMGGMDGHSEWTETAAYDPNGTNDNSLYLTNIPGHQSDHKALNLKFLAKKYEEGWLPVDSKQLKLWVKVGGCNDGYFSDWIVTFMPADDNIIEETYDYRVIAEDLNALEASDFDFNDVVFDVIPNEAKTAAKIVLRACGGIYKLTVAGKEVHEAFAEAYPNAGYGVRDNGLYPMINTNPWNPEIKVTLFEALSGDFSDNNIRTTIKNIVIKVYKPNYSEDGIELEATTGRAACKILVDTEFPVVTERHNIADEHELFTDYVTGYFANEFWWRRGVDPNAQ